MMRPFTLDELSKPDGSDVEPGDYIIYGETDLGFEVLGMYLEGTGGYYNESDFDHRTDQLILKSIDIESDD